MGYNEPSVYTEPEDAPNFLGIDSVTINGNVKATLTWKPAELKSNVASKVAKYKIWANLNRAIGSVSPSIDYSAQPIAVVTSSTAKTYTIDSGLGDNLPYVFAVTACTHNDLCSGSTVYKTASTGENGAPKNATGITEMGTLAGGVSIKAPWNESMGEIAKRRVYMGTTASTSISDYTQIKTIPISLKMILRIALSWLALPISMSSILELPRTPSIILPLLMKMQVGINPLLFPLLCIPMTLLLLALWES